MQTLFYGVEPQTIDAIRARGGAVEVVHYPGAPGGRQKAYQVQWPAGATHEGPTLERPYKAHIITVGEAEFRADSVTLWLR